MDWIDGEGEWLSSREGEGGQNSALCKLEREMEGKNELFWVQDTYIAPYA